MAAQGLSSAYCLPFGWSEAVQFPCDTLYAFVNISSDIAYMSGKMTSMNLHRRRLGYYLHSTLGRGLESAVGQS